MANNGQSYRGIHYSIKAAGSRCWKWTIEPPESVQGLHIASGEVRGQVRYTIVAAYREITIGKPSVNALMSNPLSSKRWNKCPQLAH
jgi:hypothetical protein